MKHITAGIPVVMGVAVSGAAEIATGWARFTIVVIGGVFTVLVGQSLWRKRRYEAGMARMALCQKCREFNGGPQHCSVPVGERPAGCPADKHKH